MSSEEIEKQGAEKEPVEQAEAAPEESSSESPQEKPQEESQENPQAPSDEPKKSGGATALLGGDIEISYEKELEKYHIGGVKAYQAYGKGAKAGGLFALLCEKQLTPRLADVDKYSSIINPALASLVKGGVVYWPPAKQERYVLVYSDNLGKPLLPAGVPEALGWKQEEIMDYIIPSMMSVLQDFRDKDFVHGAIRPSNMFDGGAVKIEKIILGDCLSSPSSYAQPAIYETIERAMADPIGRGEGAQADDLYALGVSITVLMRNNDPLVGMSNEDIIKQKIEVGSYSAITGKDRFIGEILELLRGILHDDFEQRWTLEEVMSWLDGRRLTPKQTTKQKKAPRPIELGGERHFRLPLLAMGLDVAPTETQQLIESGNLEQWLMRSLEDSETIERLEGALAMAADMGHGPDYQERLFSNVSIALDPGAPVRFSGAKIMGDGAGAALAEKAVLKEDLRPFADMLSCGIFLNWLMVQTNQFLDITALMTKFDNCRKSVRDKKFGYGVERCIYLLNPSSHCISEKLENYYVLTPEDMMYAFEEMCQKGNAPALFLDRHSAAFLSVKDRKVIDSYLFDLNAAENYKKLLGNLKCLATIQKRSVMPAFPAIAAAFVDMLPMVYARYHDQKIRTQLEKNITRFAEEGDLVKIAGLLDSPEVVEKDYNAFRHAVHEHIQLSKEYLTLEERLADKDNFGKKTGQDMAAVFSSIFASIIILIVAFMALTNQSIF